MLNVILHHVGMLCIICPNEKMRYEIDKMNHPDWLNKVPWYNKDIFQSCMEDYMKILEHMEELVDIISCVLLLHTIKNPSNEEKEISIGDRLIPKHVKTEALKALGANFNFIYFCLNFRKRINTLDV